MCHAGRRRSGVWSQWACGADQDEECMTEEDCAALEPGGVWTPGVCWEECEEDVCRAGRRRAGVWSRSQHTGFFRTEDDRHCWEECDHDDCWEHCDDERGYRTRVLYRSRTGTSNSTVFPILISTTTKKRILGHGHCSDWVCGENGDEECVDEADCVDMGGMWTAGECREECHCWEECEEDVCRA